MEQPLTAYAVKNSAGMFLTPTGPEAHGFGHLPWHMPRLFPDARAAEKARRAIPMDSRGDTSIVVVEWQQAETIGHSE